MAHKYRTLRNIADFIIVFECSAMVVSRLGNFALLSGQVLEAALLIATTCVWLKHSLAKQISTERDQQERNKRIADLQSAALLDMHLLRERKSHSRMSRAINH